MSLGFFAACQKSEEKKGEAQSVYDGPTVKNDWLVMWLPANPSMLNPILSTDAYARSVEDMIFDSLIAYDVETGDPVGRLAESWTISDDGLTYQFKLREGLKFSDGKPLTAEDVKFSFDLIKNPNVNAAHLQNYFKNLKSTEVISPLEVKFNLSEPYFRNLIMLGLAQILPKHLYSEGDFNKSPLNRAPVGSGPYKLLKWDSGRSIELDRNPDWWGLNVDYWKDRYNFNKILFRIITEDNVAAMALKKGEIDMLEPTPHQYIKDFDNKEITDRLHRLKYSTDDGNGYRYIGWNLKKPLFASTKVRRALAHALPREELNEKMYQGLLNLSVGPFPQGSEKLDPSVKPIPYDLEIAKKLLEEEGWKDSDGDGILDKDGKKFEFEILFVAQVPEVERIALVYQQALKQLGIKMNIKTLEWTVFLKDVMAANFDSVMMAWGSSLDSDPYQIWHSSQIESGGSNRIAYSNPRVDAILEQARVTLDKKKRNELYQEFSRIMAEETPYLFVFERPNLMIVSNRFEDVLPVGKLGLDSTRIFTPTGREKYKSQ